MSAYRRLARSKKGMSTIFGALFFVIIILMGFNVMLWGFVQWDAYNRTIANMSQRDQQAISENIVPVNSTCNSSCKIGSGTLYIWVDNLGGESVTIDTIYLYNVNGTGPCSTAPCMSSPAGGTGNIPAGSVNFAIQTNDLNNGNGIGSYSYHIILASSRGRLFSLYWPWRFNSLTVNNNGGGGNFVTNVGPLAIYFDFRSFNYTVAGTGACSGIAPNPSCTAFCMPTNTQVILYLRVANTATDSNVTLLSQTALQAQGYGKSASGLVVNAWIEAPNTVNPSSPFAYSLSNPYVLQPAGPNGPTASSFAIVKIGGSGPNQAGSVAFGTTGSTQNLSWITFIGIYYLYRGQPQGETIPFMDFVNNAPNCIQ